MGLYLSVGFLTALVLYGAIRLEIEPVRIFLAVSAAVLALTLVLKYPVALMVALAYVGTFKNRGAVGVSLNDPTVIAAALLCAAIVLHSLLSAVGLGNRSLRDLLAGQMVGVVAFCLLILVIAISYSYTSAPQVGGEKVMKLVAFDLPIFLAPLIFLRTDREVRQFILLSILASLALACRTVYRVAHPTTDVLLGFDDPTEIGEGLLMGAAALMALYYPFPVKRLFRAALIGCIVVLALGVTASISRSAIYSLLLVIAASLVCLPRNATVLSRKAILVASAAIVITVFAAHGWLANLPATHSKLGEKASELRLTLDRLYHPSGTAGQRYSFAESAWQAFLSRPLIGWGAGDWSRRWHYSDGRIVKYPHNFVLEIAAEQGLVGLAVLFCLLLATLRACNKVLRAANGFVFIVPLMALSLMANAVSGQIDSREMWLWCGTLFALARMANSYSLPPWQGEFVAIPYRAAEFV